MKTVIILSLVMALIGGVVRATVVLEVCGTDTECGCAADCLDELTDANVSI
jgi:hypothetical protein